MPITNVNRGSDSGGANRTTFRPPWVKTAGEPAAAPAQPSWVKKKAGDSTVSPSSLKSTNNTQTKQSTSPSKTTKVVGTKSSPDPAPVKKTPAVPVKKEMVPSPSNPLPKDAKLQSREVKVPVMTERRPSQPVTPLKPVLKKAPAKVESSSEEEEEEEDTDEEEEEYTEEEVEEECEEEEEEEMDEEMAEMERLLEEAKKEAAKAAREERMKKELAEKTKQDKLMVKLKPVLKKTPTIEEIPKEKPKSFLETPKLRKVVKDTEKLLEKPAKPKLEMPALKKVVKKDSPVVVKSDPEWKSETVLQPVKNVPPPPPPPPMNGMPPPPPPPPGMPMEKKELTEKQKETLSKLKTRPRKRPDWSDMMAEVEQGRKLKHVECNDRSQPILTCKSMAKVDGQFIFETEKDEKASKHNAMLKQIQFGIKLKPTKTNDRSKPDLSGLRKFRKQMTIEEQIKKSESRATMPIDAPVESEEDEMDDIDKLRDDLQSTKQMLSQELRNKEAQERENKRLLAKIQQMEAELERERNKGGSGGGDSSAASSGGGSDEALVKALRQEAEEAHKTSKELEKKYNSIAEQLDAAKADVEEKNRKIAALEKQLADMADLWDSEEDYYHLQRARSKGPGYGNRRESEAATRDSSPEPEPEVSDGDEDEDEEKKAERQKRKVAREVRVLRHKLTRLKEKEEVAKQERHALKMVKKTQQEIMKEEKKKYKALQKEVNKMAKLMAMDDEDEDEDEDKPEKKEEPEEESESEEEESEDESSGSEDEEEDESETEEESAPDEAKKANLEPRVTRHEGILAALKKSNVLHQANVDRVKDEINKHRELSDQLQHDLDSVLSELG